MPMTTHMDIFYLVLSRYKKPRNLFKMLNICQIKYILQSIVIRINSKYYISKKKKEENSNKNQIKQTQKFTRDSILHFDIRNTCLDLVFKFQINRPTDNSI